MKADSRQERLVFNDPMPPIDGRRVQQLELCRLTGPKVRDLVKDALHGFELRQRARDALRSARNSRDPRVKKSAPSQDDLFPFNHFPE